ncbi:DUF7660 family protein [Gottfriedia acidiceleris]|uniref:DUF7660 family protein n=1 Tax=Gottfriedia acidiceleris TaxID=371036 RepID=UPI002FFEF5C8
MELSEKIDGVKSREDLIRFIFDMRMDIRNNREKWENITLENYLEAMETWVNDMDGYYLNTKQTLPKQPTWKIIADLLYASSIYE